MSGCCGSFVPPMAGSGGGGGGGGDGITIENDGVALPGTYTTLNFIGDVVAEDAGGGVADIYVNDPTRIIEYFDDFLSDRLSFFSVAGGGSNGGGGSDMGSNGPGTYTQTVTAVADGARIVCARASGSAAVVFFGGGVVKWAWRHQIPTLSDGTNRIVLRAGMFDGAVGADASDGVYLEYDLATHGNHNYWLCAANNSSRTKRDTGIAAVAGSNRTAIITVNAAGTLASVTIDGVPGALTVAADIPTTSARNTFAANIQTIKSLGSGALTTIHDYYKFRQIFTTPR